MNVRLTPPWFTLRNQLLYTIGMSPHIDVSHLTTVGAGVYEIIISTFDNPDIAIAVRAIVPSVYHFNNITVKTTVLDLSSHVVEFNHSALYTTRDIGNLFCCAFTDNPLLIGFILTEEITSPVQQLSIGKVVIVASENIIQFFNEDITNFCQNYIDIVANILSDTLNSCYNPNIKVSFTTNCPNSEIMQLNLKRCC